MKKIHFVFIALLVISQSVRSQVITQSAEGTGTVIMEGSTISLDLGKTDLSFGWNNLNKNIVKSNNGWLMGGEVKVKNSDGIGSLFSKGELVPQGGANLFFGRYWSNAELMASEDGKYLKMKKVLLDKAKQLLEDTLFLEIDKIAADNIQDPLIKKRAIDAVNEQYKKAVKNGSTLFVFQPSRFKVADDDANIKAFRTALQKRMLEVKENVEKPYRQISNARFLSKVKFNKSRQGYYKFTAYLFGGINAMDFKRFDKIDSTNLENSFVDEYFRGGHFGVGLNFEYWRFRFGLTYTYVKTSNFSSLTATEYTLQSSTVINNQTLQTKDVVTAYSGGKYGRVEKNDLNIDVIYNCKLDKDGENHILINPYLRASMFSRDKSLLINKANLGIGGYFFKESGKFLGGLYIELPDINNNIEKKKPVDKQNLKPPLKRLSFGIVAKFSLKALFDW
jgi:hypothetical protein